MLADSAATAATTTMVAVPPNTTEGTVPIRAAATVPPAWYNARAARGLRVKLVIKVAAVSDIVSRFC